MRRFADQARPVSLRPQQGLVQGGGSKGCKEGKQRERDGRGRGGERQGSRTKFLFQCLTLRTLSLCLSLPAVSLCLPLSLSCLSLVSPVYYPAHLGLLSLSLLSPPLGACLYCSIHRLASLIGKRNRGSTIRYRAAHRHVIAKRGVQREEGGFQEGGILAVWLRFLRVVVSLFWGGMGW